MKILVADAFPKEQLAPFSAVGLTVEHRPDLPAKDLPGAARDASILVVRSKQVAQRCSRPHLRCPWWSGRARA